MALLPVDEAIEKIGAAVKPLAAEMVSLEDAAGRRLTADVIAKRTQPPFDASAMDGYAVRAADLSPLPAALKVIGEAPAGRAFEGRLQPGEAVRIFTGGVLPEGADTVVIQEDTERDGNTVRVLEAPAKGRHIRLAGLDFREDATVLAAGTKLGPAELSLAAAAGHVLLEVYRRPRIAFFATGDELVPPGEIPGPSQIIASTGAGLAALIREAGGEPLDLGIARDTRESLLEKAAAAKDADMLVTLGGASVGEHDLVQGVLGEAGLKVGFWKIAMRPGKPLMFGDFAGRPFLGLPGNPVSALVCAELFLTAALARLQGGAARHPALLPARLGAPLGENDTRRDYIRATLEDGPEGPVATALPVQDSSMLSGLARAGCLIVRDPHSPTLDAGASVRVLPLKR
ncbi:molybdopterin molybdotransferase MoeA [Tepidicaulis sp. LMO-SS28]|uniref:molybdopterin molybdotransferase MoeA n=1 Tax=Tepidicaulis sp. LMO-SS28 TaxID=3447455 RepID=UPI003EDFDF95